MFVISFQIKQIAIYSTFKTRTCFYECYFCFGLFCSASYSYLRKSSWIYLSSFLSILKWPNQPTKSSHRNAQDKLFVRVSMDLNLPQKNTDHSNSFLLHTFNWITLTAFRWFYYYFSFFLFSCPVASKKRRKISKLLLNKLKRKIWIWCHNLWSISKKWLHTEKLLYSVFINDTQWSIRIACIFDIQFVSLCL